MTELTNEDVMIWLRAKWSEMYQELREHGPDRITNELNMEYARRRKIYERMIWELGNPNELTNKKK
jgi:hypothetical protein